ncbi:DUF418 domain-containing protein [Streptomyces sp. WMMC940]|uniref:DUF418 domain-containing protein n=1 Tax=Streptomyces sp. WMMC940 TaxID=3015153 RepID=UPI0022B692ED|nr:DUF418 domain-containing protein [Streptomyces sp. WMMC940]MCZ7457444.1 DUF418 domain-containing protein [Streptomyces sp. WMMC940]
MSDGAARLPEPGAPSHRALAPDLARGLMLLIVALVHAHMFVRGSAVVIRGYPPVSGPADALTAGLLTALADSRSFPMFALLFGYGTGRILTRERERGRDGPGARAVLRRRSRWLLVFGFAHALLLFAGDVLGAYGLLGLVAVGLTDVRDRALFTLAGAGALLGALLYGGMLAANVSGDPADTAAAVFLAADPASDAAYRVGTWVFTTPLFALVSLGPFLVGAWAARQRILEEPGRHRVLLRRVAVTGTAAGVAGGLPLALITSGTWTTAPSGVTLGLSVLHVLTGYAGGCALAAAVALLALRLGGRRSGAVVTAVAACGRRSMSCYVWQSVVWLVLFAPYAFGLGDRVGVHGSALVAFGTWCGGVLIAELLRRLDRRGPAEALLHRASRRAGNPPGARRDALRSAAESTVPPRA